MLGKHLTLCSWKLDVDATGTMFWNDLLLDEHSVRRLGQALSPENSPQPRVPGLDLLF